jgi:hypothetical protein
MTDTPLTDAHVRQLADGLKHPHWVAFARGLERENADLRADKQRIDWLATALGGYWAREHFEHRSRISRAYIDAGMADNPTPAELKDK